MKIVTIVGARPQFIKASTVSRHILLASDIQEILIHTGQHFDQNMSDLFFEQLAIPRPYYKLDINSLSHGEMTGKMLIEIEQILVKEQPDIVLVYGDTNSTLAGALAASKLHIPVAHVEAGLRSCNMKMPEEINRILTDQVSEILFCPTEHAVENLKKEGFSDKNVDIILAGDVMQDASLLFAEFSKKPNIPIEADSFIVATLHRAENTDDVDNLSNIIYALNLIHKEIIPVIMPLHPRTAKIVKDLGLELHVQTTAPVGYLEMIWLLQHTSLVLTDSGGLQKEAFFFGKGCVTMREETEWTELVTCKANFLTGADAEKIIQGVKSTLDIKIPVDMDLYGDGNASFRIVSYLKETF
ncbi:MAG: UDP-N-acetylglucosamine 2-epimerase (non-hydrolyzing) [Desulfobacterales bacterium]|nr:MAG: UDP-N-acetylglucosamine 2-epimerase (non-hydrolyzing) [Desulfobacterales bacterium]